MATTKTVSEINSRLREIDSLTRNLHLLTGHQISELNSERKELIALAFGK